MAFPLSEKTNIIRVFEVLNIKSEPPSKRMKTPPLELIGNFKVSENTAFKKI
jgi:hypothetical protein